MPKTPTMLEWMFAPEAPLDRMLRRGAASVIFAGIVTAGMKQFSPTSTVNTVVCLIIALALLIPPALVTVPPRDRLIRVPVLVLGAAFAWMALLFFFDASGILRFGVGFETVTDVIGTLFFAGGWFLMTSHVNDPSEQNADRVSIVLVCVLLVIAGAAKVVVSPADPNANPALLSLPQRANVDAARLLLNVGNAAVLWGLYSLMRRLLPPPDPLTHTLILLYGCAQIAAPARDCLKDGCVTTLQTIVAFSVAWSLLIGKVAVGLYVAYLYFNGAVSPRRQREPGSGAGDSNPAPELVVR
ncbi:MAG TPA: hypothetical protein VI485_09365 [Vicinamibacterales bacterium]|nr:hypothetical protein [Vicinamibacterales bacterium]